MDGDNFIIVIHRNAFSGRSDGGYLRRRGDTSKKPVQRLTREAAWAWLVANPAAEFEVLEV